MNPVIVIALVAGVGVVGAVGSIVSYNRFVNDQNAIETSWATVDAELQRRHGLIPRLESVRSVAAHEQTLLIRAARAHDVAVASRHTPSSATRHEPAVAAAAADLVALRERYPQLDAQPNFLDLQHRLTITEDRIAAARRYYNMVVAKLNRRVDAFPSNIDARRCGIGQAEYFEV